MSFNHKVSRYNQNKSIKYRGKAKEAIKKAMLANPHLGAEKLAKLTGYSTGITGIYYMKFKRHGLK